MRRTSGKSSESETFLEMQARRKLGARGKSAEALVQAWLTKRKAADPTFDFDRLLDSRAAGAIISPQCCDYMLYAKHFGVRSLEIKELAKGDRLPQFVQLPRMLRREDAGVEGWLVVRLVEESLWVTIRTLSLTLEAKSFHVKSYPGAYVAKTLDQAMERVGA